MSSEWSSTRLRDMVSIKHGFAFKGEFFVDEETPLQLTTPGNFAIGGGFQYGKGKYYAGPVPADYVLQTGDLIVTMTDLSKAADTLGYAAVVPNGTGTTWLHNQRVGLVRPQEGVNVHMGYIHYLMRSPDYRHWVVSTATGSTVKHTSPDRILSYEFLLPSLAEQREIGETLATLDDRITLLRETNATLEAIAQALFKSWFVDFDPVRAKAEGCLPEGMDATTAALFPDSFEESALGLVPKGWQIGRFGDLLSESTTRVGKQYSTVLSAVQTGQLVLSESHFNKRVHSENTEKYKAVPHLAFAYNPSRINIGSIGLNEFLFLGAVSPVYVVVIPRNRGAAYLIWHQLRTDRVRNLINGLATGSVRQSLAYSDFESIPLVIPSDEVVNAFMLLRSYIYQKASSAIEQAQILTQLRDTLLPRLISGQLRLPDAEQAVEEALA